MNIWKGKRIFTELATEGSALTLLEYGTYAANGYTYYILQAIYNSPNTIGQYDAVYVQISENEGIEVCDVWFNFTLEEFVNSVFYVR